MQKFHSTRARIGGVALAALAVAGLGVGSAVAGGKGETKSEHWGVINRNTIGSPVAELRDGPYVTRLDGTVSAPPFGKGSLEIITGDGTEKAAFGNEVDFVGDPVSELSAAGFYVLRTGEDVGYGGTSNMPNIDIEILSGGTAFATMVWQPTGAGVPVNEWSPFIDATVPANGAWYFTSGPGASTCNPTTTCTFAAAKAAVPDAIITSIAVTKGRDNQFQGSVDGLRINDKSYDFEAAPEGVKAKGVK